MEEKENLIIVESPAKAKTIEKILGKNYKVKSSFGHIRDLSKRNLGIDIEHDFKPEYVIPDEKRKVVQELKKAVKNARHVLLASDEDREGEAIAWHLSEVLKLPAEGTKRIVFHEITPVAIKQALITPRSINLNLVHAQQARRILDRLVGFEISPILWKKVKPSLSAGRVQSVAVRLIVEREREIRQFTVQTYFRVTGEFYLTQDHKTYLLKADLNERLSSRSEAEEFLNFIKGKTFTVTDVTKKPLKRTPPPPFTTSTLQQEASRRLKYSVSYTMSLAQRLYESGFITYMRTDSVNLSTLALNASHKKIKTLFGEKYAKARNFKTKTKGAQEAHEAIRPTFPDRETVPGSRAEQRLYELIWKRTIASQMEDALIEKTTVTITPKGSEKYFIATGEVVKFDGFLKVYSDKEDSEKSEQVYLPPIDPGTPLKYKEVSAIEKFTQPPPRYSEAMLVRKLEELGVGRPSTYAPTITTVQQRGYVIKEDRPGETRNVVQLTLKENQDRITEKTLKENVGKEKSKLYPSDIGILVNDFLLEHFADILDYNFTATVEKQFDEIAEGKLNWSSMIKRFYADFHPKVESTEKISRKHTGERVLGKDPVTGEEVLVKIGRYGPVAQIGRGEGDEKPRYASLRKGQLIETITLQEALDLFKLPRAIGVFEEKEMIAGIGRFGPYIRHDNKFYSIPLTEDPLAISEEKAIAIIQGKRETEKKKVIKTFEEDSELQILNGRWGPYIKWKKKNFRIPKKLTPENLTYKECMKIISEAPKKKNK
ncbi:MAG: type I DNA topoisomerase [Bacteroidales bacterium]|nr:type I DNA topoisomerase [Bacteroidales bacterium]